MDCRLKMFAFTVTAVLVEQWFDVATAEVAGQCEISLNNRSELVIPLLTLFLWHPSETQRLLEQHVLNLVLYQQAPLEDTDLMAKPRS